MRYDSTLRVEAMVSSVSEGWYDDRIKILLLFVLIDQLDRYSYVPGSACYDSAY